MSQITNQPDRVSYSFGEKRPGDVQYSMVDVHFSYSTDILAGETAEQAMARARRFVHEQCEKKRTQAEGDARTRPPQPERGQGGRPAQAGRPVFDPNNPFHRSRVNELFDQHDLRSPARRKALAEQRLAGKPLDEVPKIVAEQAPAYKRPVIGVDKGNGTKSNWDGSWPRNGYDG